MESSTHASSSHESHKTADQGNLIMDEELWKDFPPNLHVEILGSFSIRELCRFRTISPDWNYLAEHLISRAWNGIMEELKARPQAMYVFRTPKILDLGVGSSESLVRLSWEVYDPSARQCFPLNMQFLNTKDEFGRLCVVEEGCIIIAADKGFICVVPNFLSEKIKVVNPMTGCVVELPPLLGFKFRLMSVLSVLVVAENYSSFSSYVFTDYRSKRFDSYVGVWTELPQPPPTFDASHILHLKFSLFIISWVIYRHNVRAHLLVLDTTTTRSEWCDTGVEFPLEVASLHLATTLGRLFIVVLLTDRIELWEVDCATFSCTVVVSMDKINKFYGYKFYKIVVVGCGNFIVFSSVNGASVAYDLVNSKWCEWTQSKKIPKPNYWCRRSLYGTSMSLTLNPVPAVHRSI